MTAVDSLSADGALSHAIRLVGDAVLSALIGANWQLLYAVVEPPGQRDAVKDAVAIAVRAVRARAEVAFLAVEQAVTVGIAGPNHQVRCAVAMECDVEEEWRDAFGGRLGWGPGKTAVTHEVQREIRHRDGDPLARVHDVKPAHVHIQTANAALDQNAERMLPFSQARMIEVTEAGKVIYKTEHNTVGRFPEPGDEELLAGPARNFQVFDPLDFLAACPP